MGTSTQETYAEFLDSLKSAGVEISNEPELRERLAETSIWRYAFMIMARNGRAIGINFMDRGARSNVAKIRNTFSRFQFPANSDSVFTANLASD